LARSGFLGYFTIAPGELLRTALADLAGWSLTSGEGSFAGAIRAVVELPVAVSVTRQPLGRALVGLWLWRATLEVSFENSPSQHASARHG
jgi:hypothetical protein